MKPTFGKIVLAPTDAIDALQPYVDHVMRAIAVVCDEPDWADSLVTDESWLSDFSLTDDDRQKLAAMLGIELDPENCDDNVIYRVAAKLREHERRSTA